MLSVTTSCWSDIKIPFYQTEDEQIQCCLGPGWWPHCNDKYQSESGWSSGSWRGLQMQIKNASILSLYVIKHNTRSTMYKTIGRYDVTVVTVYWGSGWCLAEHGGSESTTGAHWPSGSVLKNLKPDTMMASCLGYNQGCDKVMKTSQCRHNTHPGSVWKSPARAGGCMELGEDNIMTDVTLKGV